MGLTGRRTPAPRVSCPRTLAQEAPGFQMFFTAPSSPERVSQGPDQFVQDGGELVRFLQSQGGLYLPGQVQVVDMVFAI